MATQSQIEPTLEMINGETGLRFLAVHFARMGQYKYLLRNLIVRDIKVRYKNSLLGMLWSLLNPLMMMLVFTFVFGVLFARSDVRNYPIFFLIGILPWNFFSSSVMGGTVSISGGASMIKKVFFPRELLPLAKVLANLVHLGLAFVVFLIYFYFSGMQLTLHALWVPALLVTQVLFTLGLVLLFSAIHVFYRDIVMILDVAMLAWFFLTPIVYPLERLGTSAQFLGFTVNPIMLLRWFNPMASIIDGYRTVLWGTPGSLGAASMDPAYFARTFATSVVVFLVGYAIFLANSDRFAEKL